MLHLLTIWLDLHWIIFPALTAKKDYVNKGTSLNKTDDNVVLFFLSPFRQVLEEEKKNYVVVQVKTASPHLLFPIPTV